MLSIISRMMSSLLPLLLLLQGVQPIIRLRSSSRNLVRRLDVGGGFRLMAQHHAAAVRGVPHLGGWGRGGVSTSIPPPPPSLSATSSSSQASDEDDVLLDDMRRLAAIEDKDILCVYSPQDLKAVETPQLAHRSDVEEDEEELRSKTSCIIIDPFSDFLGKHLKRAAKARGLVCVDVLSAYTAAALGSSALKWRAPRPGKEAAWASKLPFQKVAFVLSESDVGTATAERMQQAIGAPGNGVNPIRRNKYLTNEALKRRGAASTKQIMAGDWQQVEDFLSTLPDSSSTSTEAPIAVVKPSRGAASGDVYVCRTKDEVKNAYEKLLGTPKYGGGFNDRVLIQEYLQGQEFAVDTVSRDGEHKVVGIWKYDKRPANDAPVVYFCTELRAAPEGSEEKAVCDYVLDQVLPALDVKWGPTHTEVIMTEDRGPVIVELNARWHLCNFLPVTEACLGCNAVDVTLDAFTDPEAFDAIPRIPDKVKATGRVVHLVCFGEGEVKEHRHLEEIQALESLQALEIYDSFGIGEEVTPTVDIRSDAGYALLIHEDPEVVQRDYETIQKLQPDMLVIEPKKKS